MYYYEKIPIDLAVDGYPKEYPAFYLFNQDDVNRLTSLLTEAMLTGMNPKYRKLCFTGNCSEGIPFSVLLEKMKAIDKFEEIPDDIAAVYHSLPHWNPVKDAIKVLGHFIEASKILSGQETEIQMDKTQQLEEAIQSAGESSQRYDRFYGSKSGAIKKTESHEETI